MFRDPHNLPDPSLVLVPGPHHLRIKALPGATSNISNLISICSYNFPMNIAEETAMIVRKRVRDVREEPDSVRGPSEEGRIE